jgi:hypothetical protein
MTSYAHPSLDDLKLPLTNGKLFKILDDDVPDYIFSLLQEKFEFLSKNSVPDGNFIGNHTVESNNNSKGKYYQWYLQSEPDFLKWKYEDLCVLDDYFKQWVDEVHHFKFSLTSPETDISWHVLHELPRIHIPLSSEGCIFDIVDTSQTIHSYRLEPKKVYMLNVCFPHRVKHQGKEVRKQAFFSFKNLKSDV